MLFRDRTYRSQRARAGRRNIDSIRQRSNNKVETVRLRNEHEKSVDGTDSQVTRECHWKWCDAETRRMTHAWRNLEKYYNRAKINNRQLLLLGVSHDQGKEGGRKTMMEPKEPRDVTTHLTS